MSALADNTVLHRLQCVVTADNEKSYHLFVFEPLREWRLPPLDIWSWLLIDGKSPLVDLIAKVRERYPEAPVDEVRTVFAQLAEKGLALTTAPKQKRELPDINLYLADFPEDIKPVDSYFVWLFSRLADTLTLTEKIEEADAILYFDEARAPTEPLNPEVKKILITRKYKTKQSYHQSFDLVLSSDSTMSARFCSMWVRLPGYAFRPGALGAKDSTKIETIGPGYSTERILQRMGDRMAGREPARPPAANKPAQSKRYPLTVAMATFDDYDGVYFSVTALLLYHAKAMAECEVLILDNDPEGPAAKHLKGLANGISNVRYEPYNEQNGTAVRDMVFHFAQGDWVLCMDSHVMFAEGAIQKLLDYIRAHPESKDMLQGPLMSDAGKAYASEFTSVWNKGMYGVWGFDQRASNKDNPPFEIEMQGLGMFVCRKAAWPGFNKRFSGFGGEEGYIHQKIRNNGGRCLCAPFIPWSHRFGRPHGAKYRLKWEDRIRNYLIGFEEVGLDKQTVIDHFTEHLNKKVVDDVVKGLEKEQKSPYHIFPKIFCLSLDHDTGRWQGAQNRFEKLGITDEVQKFSAIHTPEHHHIGCALSHRQIIENAKRNGLESILVFEDDMVMLESANLVMSMALPEILKTDWKILYLGGCQHGAEFPYAEGCRFLMKPTKGHLTCTQAIAYHHTIYDRILDDVPDNEVDMQEWLHKHYGIDQYYRYLDDRYMVFPKPFSQANIIPAELPAAQPFYK